MPAIETAYKVVAAVVGANAIKDLGDKIGNVSTASQKMQKSFAQAALALKAFAASEVVLKLKELVASNIELADHINDTSMKTGVAVETLAGYAVAAKNSGTNLDSLASGIAKLNKNMIAAREGTGEVANAFRVMGISVKDTQGNMRAANEVIGDMSQLFHDMPDGAAKSALAIAVFGKSGAELIPFLNNGREGLTEFNLAISKEFAQSADQFNDKLGVMKSQLQNVGLTFTSGLLPSLGNIVNAFADIFGTEPNWRDFGETVGTVLKSISAVALGVITVIKDLIAGMQYAFDVAGQLAANSANLFNGNKLQNVDPWEYASGRLAGRIGQNHEDLNKSISDLMGENNITVSKRITPQSRINSALGFNPTAAGNAEAATKALDAWLLKEREAITTLAQESQYIGKTSIEIEKMKDARKLDAEFAEKSKDLKGPLLAKYKAEEEAIKSLREQILQKNYDESRSFSAGAQSFFVKYAEDAKNSAEQIKGALTDAFKGAEDALVNFVTTGKLSFTDMANSIIKDLARIVIQKSITGPLADALGGIFGGFGGGGFSSSEASSIIAANPAIFANGGIMTSNGSIPLRAYAGGGIANSPQLSLFGEGRMPEAYVPLPDGRRIPVAMKGGAGGGTNVTVNVNMTNGNTDTQGGDKDAARLGTVIAASVKSILINEKRPGGLLAKA